MAPSGGELICIPATPCAKPRRLSTPQSSAMQHPLRFIVLAASALALWSTPSAQAYPLVSNSSSLSRKAAGAATSVSIDGSQEIDIAVGCGDTTYPVATTSSSPGNSSKPMPRFSYVVENPLAQFISVHFARFHLPANDYVVIRATNDPTGRKPSFTYTGKDYNTSFFSDTIYAKSVTVELFTTSSSSATATGATCTGFAIDSYQYLAQAASFAGSAMETVCGPDDSQEAACFRNTPVAFETARAVVRLVIRKQVVENNRPRTKSYFCTGWLVGEEGHVMTNNHCIANQDHASETEFMFEAQGSKCDTNCGRAFGCESDVRTRGSQLVISNEELDYALVKIDPKWSKKYGYLKMRDAGAELEERIYIPQHPAGWGKRLAMKAGNDWGRVVSLTRGGCLPNQVAYFLDTQGGSSGSPVVSWKDHAVVAIHHCGGCPNTAVNMQKIAADLRARNLLPRDSVASSLPK